MTAQTCPRCHKPVVMVETKKGYPVAMNIGGPHAYLRRHHGPSTELVRRKG